MKPYPLTYSDEARTRIRHLHPTTKAALREALGALREDPWLGKPLQRELFGFHALRCKHYRVIYQITESPRGVHVLTLGPRKTIYDEFAPRNG